MTTGSLQDLLAVQDLDLAADQLRHRRSNLAERAELSALDGEADTIRAELTDLERRLQELTDRQTSVEAELAATEERAGAVDRRLFGGEVTASRELQAMSSELDQLKSRASALEDAALEVMEEREPLDSRAAELRARLDGLAGRRADIQARLGQEEQSIDAELAGVGSRRSEAAEAVPEGLLATYERLRSRLGGVGVARLAGNRCNGCHLTLPAVELERVRHLPAGQVYQCEQCSRILVP